MKPAVCILIGCFVIGAVAPYLLDGVIHPQWEHAMAYKHDGHNYYWEDTEHGFWPRGFIDYMDAIGKDSQKEQINILKFARDNGWELVAIGEDKNGPVLYFKRRK